MGRAVRRVGEQDYSTLAALLEAAIAAP